MNDGLFKCLLQDVKQYNLPEARWKITIYKAFVTKRGFRALYIHRMKHLHKKSSHRFRYKFWMILDVVFNKTIEINDDAEIGPGFKISHPFSIVIGGCKIGNNCSINTRVSVGANYSIDEIGNRYPTLGDHVVIGPGAVVIGPINIGSNVVIGANSVITKDVPDNVVIVGSGRIIGEYDKKRFG